MADQELSAVERADDASRKHSELKEWLSRYLGMLREAGLSQNQFAVKYGYGSSQVSNAHREKADGKYFPRAKMIDALCTELSERCDVQEGALAALRRLHREALEALCTVPNPHHTHVLMLTELHAAERIASIAYQVGSDQLRMTQLIEERDSLRQDRDDQRERARSLQVQIDELTRKLSALADEKRDCLSRRDGASAELDRLVPSDRSAPAGIHVDLGVFHEEHPSISPAVPVGQLPAGAHHTAVRVPAGLKAAGAAVAAVLLLFAGVGIAQMFGGENTPADTTNGKGATSASPSPKPSPTPSARQSDTPTPPATTTPTPQEPLAVGSLNFTGANWAQGTWSLSGRNYPKSLAWVRSCDDDESVLIPLPRAYSRFSATVGVDDESADAYDRDRPVDFDLWADLDGDGIGDRNELVASRGATAGKPATIDVDIRGATQLILQIEVSHCSLTTLVWGSPEVR